MSDIRLYYEPVGEDWEEYMRLDAAVREVLNYVCDPKSPLPDAVVLTEYAPVPFDIETAVGWMIDAVNSVWDEGGYGDPNGNDNGLDIPTKDVDEVLKPLVAKWAKASYVWSCEATGRTVTVTRAERPDLWPIG